MFPGVEILPFTLALPMIFPLRLRSLALILLLVVMLPPAPAPLVNERSNPVPSVTLPPVLIAPEFKLPVLALPLAERDPANIALAPLMFPLALMFPGVEILPFTLALPMIFPLRLRSLALILLLVVMLPPAPAPLVNERSNPVPSVTLPPVLIAPEFKLPVLALPLATR